MIPAKLGLRLLTGPRPACRKCGSLKVWSRDGWTCPRPKCAGDPPRREQSS